MFGLQDRDGVPPSTLAMLLAGDHLRVTLLSTTLHLALGFVMATLPAAVLSTVQQKKSVTSIRSVNPHNKSSGISKA